MDRVFSSKQLAPKAAAPSVWHLAIIAAVVLWSIPAQAHKVIVFAWVQGKTVHTESKFSGGRWVRKGTITVRNDKGDILLTGTTDDQGRFSFPLPGPGGLDIVLRAGTGHGNHWKISAAEITAAQGGPVPQQGPPAASAKLPAGKTDSRAPAASGHPLTREELEQTIARQLAPIASRLAKLDSDRPAWRDIAGGIGYIVGLMGLVAFCRNRKRTIRDRTDA